MAADPRQVQSSRPPVPFEAPDQSSWPSLAVPPELIELLAGRVAELLAERLAQPPGPYLTVAEAATYIAAPKSRVYELIAQRRVRTYRDGRRVLLRSSDLDAAFLVEEVEGE